MSQISSENQLWERSSHPTSVPDFSPTEHYYYMTWKTNFKAGLLIQHHCMTSILQNTIGINWKPNCEPNIFRRPFGSQVFSSNISSWVKPYRAQLIWPGSPILRQVFSSNITVWPQLDKTPFGINWRANCEPNLFRRPIVGQVFSSNNSSWLKPHRTLLLWPVSPILRSSHPTSEHLQTYGTPLLWTENQLWAKSFLPTLLLDLNLTEHLYFELESQLWARSSLATSIFDLTNVLLAK